MTNEQLQEKILQICQNATKEEGTEWLTFSIDAKDWRNLAERIKKDPELEFDFLFCLTCVDWKTHLGMVYHLRSTPHRHDMVIKIKLDRADPQIETVSDIWRTAEFHEREQFEMFGVNFMNHPDLRLLILPDGWEGKFPLRKDYEDPVNMIKL